MTKRAGSAGRFGPRYGMTLRKKISEIEQVQRKRHICPKCGMRALVRVSTGIWQCKKCGTKVAGPAYLPPSKEV